MQSPKTIALRQKEPQNGGGVSSSMFLLRTYCYSSVEFLEFLKLFQLPAVIITFQLKRPIVRARKTKSKIFEVKYSCNVRQDSNTKYPNIKPILKGE